MENSKRKRQKVRSIFGEQLEKIARERNLSHRVLAKMAGTSTSVIGSQMGVGGAVPSDLTKVKRLADALNVDFAWLVLGEHATTRQVSVAEVFEEIVDQHVSGYWKIQATKMVSRKKP